MTRRGAASQRLAIEPCRQIAGKARVHENNFGDFMSRFSVFEKNGRRSLATPDASSTDTHPRTVLASIPILKIKNSIPVFPKLGLHIAMR